jgi:exopolyphosphatase/guanosine-5'-triphosphate,3'-diphosphate pyrophosphatase
VAESAPRFEFRTWARSFGRVEDRLRAFSPCEQIRESGEIYVVSAVTDAHNTKIRNDLMDIKKLIQVRDGLEQWTPCLKEGFPIAAGILEDKVFPALSVEAPSFEKCVYSLKSFVDELIRPHPDLVAARVFKRRFAFTIAGCIAELAEVTINGAGIQTVAVESADAAAVLEAIRTLGLGADENVSYVRAIKRVVGMEPLPD